MEGNDYSFADESLRESLLDAYQHGFITRPFTNASIESTPKLLRLLSMPLRETIEARRTSNPPTSTE
jgi:hypothetical protein